MVDCYLFLLLRSSRQEQQQQNQNKQLAAAAAPSCLLSTHHMKRAKVKSGGSWRVLPRLKQQCSLHRFHNDTLQGDCRGNTRGQNMLLLARISSPALPSVRNPGESVKCCLDHGSLRRLVVLCTRPQRYEGFGQGYTSKAPAGPRDLVIAASSTPAKAKRQQQASDCLLHCFAYSSSRLNSRRPSHIAQITGRGPGRPVTACGPPRAQAGRIVLLIAAIAHDTSWASAFYLLVNPCGLRHDPGRVVYRSPLFMGQDLARPTRALD